MPLQEDSQTVFHLIQALCRQSAAPRDIERLAQIAMVQAVAFLRMLERRGYRIRETRSEKEFEGIAADCLAEMFAAKRDGQPISVVKAFQERIDKGESESEIYIAFRQMVRFKVRQQLSELFRQRNPEHAKLLRNVRLAARRHAGLSLHRDLTGQYLRYTYESLREGISRPSFPVVQRTAAVFMRKSDSVDNAILHTVEALAKEAGQTVEIDVRHFLSVIRDLRNGASSDGVAAANPALEYLHFEELDGCAKRTLALLQQALEDGYIAKRKLSREEAAALWFALEDFCQALLHGESPGRHFHLVQKYWPELTKQQYQERVQKIFEYFILQLRQEMRRLHRIIF